MMADVRGRNESAESIEDVGYRAVGGVFHQTACTPACGTPAQEGLTCASM